MKVENLKVSFWLVTVSCEHCFHMLARKGGGDGSKTNKTKQRLPFSICVRSSPFRRWTLRSSTFQSQARGRRL